MPKKKLTKAQVNRKINLLHKNLADLINDRMYHFEDSKIKSSVNAMMKVKQAFPRLIK